MLIRATAIVLTTLELVLSQVTQANPWSAIREPTRGTPRSLGSYDGGCLAGGVALPPRGSGYQAIRLYRKRYFGHTHLIDYVRSLANRSARDGLGTLLVGDLSQPRGGLPASGHRSHQTGLDVDIWFQFLEDAQRAGLDLTTLENRNPVSMVRPGGATLDRAHWRDSHVRVLRLAAESPRVARIFVNPAIKRDLCRRETDRGWLRKLRPWWGHDDHFHVRLECPDDDAGCVSQAPLPRGDGCDASLDWWFTEEARLPQHRPLVAPKPIPSACMRLLRD
jgi:penicillin-insensitive murein endopeptidase